jgi:hypothetical protein
MVYLSMRERWQRLLDGQGSTTGDCGTKLSEMMVFRRDQRREPAATPQRGVWKRIVFGDRSAGCPAEVMRLHTMKA